jgi:hypothetical protein
MLVLNVSNQINKNDCELYIQLFFEKNQSIVMLDSINEMQNFYLEQELCIFADEFDQIQTIPTDDFYIITSDAMHLFNSTCSFKEQFKFNIRIIRYNMYLVRATKRK